VLRSSLDEFVAGLFLRIRLIVSQPPLRSSLLGDQRCDVVCCAVPYDTSFQRMKMIIE